MKNNTLIQQMEEIPMKFIACGKCNFERSYLITGKEKIRNVNWFCPACGQHWYGIISGNGKKVSIIEGTNKIKVRYVLIEMDSRYTPLTLIATRNRQSEKNEEDVMEVGERLLYLQSAEALPELEKIPEKVTRYRAMNIIPKI